MLKEILLVILATPLLGVVVLLFIPFHMHDLLKKTALSFSCLTFVLTLCLWFLFNKKLSFYQAVVHISWLKFYNISFSLGVDGISLFFLILTALLITLSLLASYDSVQHNLKGFLINFLILMFILIGVFCVLDLLLFYVFFECVLIPMYLIIGIWGSRARKIRAAYFFFLYTLIGSVLMLLSILYIYSQIGSTDYEILLASNFFFEEEQIIWLAFFASFAAKVPMVPVHLWLPEAHVEAPTAGSVILAGILLKLGTYGFIRFSLPLCTAASLHFTPLVYSFAAIGIVYTSLTAIRQTDFKRIIAYTSIAHMNLVILGIFSFNSIGIEGAIVQSLSHGFVASALFLIIGVVYDRHHTRMVKYYGGLAHVMPIYVAIFLFFTMANIGLPGTSSFVGEFLILVGSFKANTTITFIGATGMILGGCYALWLFNRIAYGNLKTQYCKEFVDLNEREFLTFLPLILGTLVMGLLPDFFLGTIHISVNRLLELMCFF